VDNHEGIVDVEECCPQNFLGRSSKIFRVPLKIGMKGMLETCWRVLEAYRVDLEIIDEAKTIESSTGGKQIEQQAEMQEKESYSTLCHRSFHSKVETEALTALGSTCLVRSHNPRGNNPAPTDPPSDPTLARCPSTSFLAT